MPGEDLFKRYLEMGASVLGMSRERAESIVKDLVASGEVARGQASKAADWLVERGRAGADELSELVRREVRQQVAALGLATKDDLDGLEARLTGSAAGPPPGAGAPMAPAGTAARARKAGAAPTKAAGAGRAAASRAKVGSARSAKVGSAPKGAAASRKTAPAATPAGTAATAPRKGAGTKKVGVPDSTVAEGEGAGITRSASVRRRPGRSGSGGPDAAPPAGGAVPPKG